MFIEKSRKQTQFRIPADKLDLIDRVAKLEGRSRTDVAHGYGGGVMPDAYGGMPQHHPRPASEQRGGGGDWRALGIGPNWVGRGTDPFRQFQAVGARRGSVAKCYF